LARRLATFCPRISKIERPPRSQLAKDVQSTHFDANSPRSTPLLEPAAGTRATAGKSRTYRNRTMRPREHPYDLRCSKDGLVRHVEVKGTSGFGDAITVTANEYAHAATSKAAESHLFVVEQIGFEILNGELKAVDGVVRYDGPFLLDEERFVVTQYRYTVPEIEDTAEDTFETQPSAPQP
jgi:hypothetical protein